MSATSEVEQALRGLRAGEVELDLPSVAAELPDLIETFLILERPDIAHAFLGKTLIEVPE